MEVAVLEFGNKSILLQSLASSCATLHHRRVRWGFIQRDGVLGTCHDRDHTYLFIFLSLVMVRDFPRFPQQGEVEGNRPGGTSLGGSGSFQSPGPGSKLGWTPRGWCPVVRTSGSGASGAADVGVPGPPSPGQDTQLRLSLSPPSHPEAPADVATCVFHT